MYSLVYKSGFPKRIYKITPLAGFLSPELLKSLPGGPYHPLWKTLIYRKFILTMSKGLQIHLQNPYVLNVYKFMFKIAR